MEIRLDLGGSRVLVFSDYSDTEYMKVTVEETSGASTITLGLVKRDDIKRRGRAVGLIRRDTRAVKGAGLRSQCRMLRRFESYSRHLSFEEKI